MCKCGSNRIASIEAHASDLHVFQVPHLKIIKEGYAPEIPNVCSGDDTYIKFCLDCGLIQNFKPITDDKIKKIIGDNDEDTE